MDMIFLTLGYPTNDNRSIYSDLMNEFVTRGHNVWVVCQSERRNNTNTVLEKSNNVNVLRVRTGNLTGKVSLIEKGVTTLTIEKCFINAIKKYIHGVKFDLVIYSTPPITFCSVVQYMKKRDNAKSYLLLKDIFPQNAVDLGMIKNNGLLYKIFRKKEKKLYCLSDYIGCMSEGNRRYVIDHNKEVDPTLVEVCPNSIDPLPMADRPGKEEVTMFRSKYSIPEDSLLIVYGGNIGKPQGIEFFIEALKELKDRNDLFFLVIGRGTEYYKIENYLNSSGHGNALLMEHMPTDEYKKLMRFCNVGLILLSDKFTIPNFPSRVTAYMEAGLPILAATDANTDLKDMLRGSGCGLWSKSGDIPAFINNIDKLVLSKALRDRMGLAGRKWLEENYTVSKSYEIIMDHFKTGR